MTLMEIYSNMWIIQPCQKIKEWGLWNSMLQLDYSQMQKEIFEYCCLSGYETNSDIITWLQL